MHYVRGVLLVAVHCEVYSAHTGGCDAIAAASSAAACHEKFRLAQIKAIEIPEASLAGQRPGALIRMANGGGKAIRAYNFKCNVMLAAAQPVMPRRMKTPMA